MVLAGGGANGAYGLGVMEALFSGRCEHSQRQAIEASIFTGTSVGAFNAAVMAALFDRSCLTAVQSLRQIWVEQIADGPGGHNGVYRIRGDVLGPNNLHALMANSLEDASVLAGDTVRRFFDLTSSQESVNHRLLRTLHIGNLISSTPLRQLIARNVDPQRLLDPRARALRIITTDWDDGKAIVFYNGTSHQMDQPTMADYELRPLTENIIVPSVRASAAVPGLFPAVAIGDHFFVDGGVVMNSPFHPAIKAGASVLHVVDLAPDVETIPFGRAPSLLETFERMAMVVPAGELAEDLVSSRQIRNLRGVARQLQRFIDDLGDDAPPLDDNVRSFMQEFAEKPKISVHVYYPSRGIDGITGLLDFRRERILGLIEMGYDDTVHHDCAANGCVV